MNAIERARQPETAVPTGHGWDLPQSRKMLVAVAVGFFLLIGVAYSFVRCPWWDEGLYADVAHQFAVNNRFGSPHMLPTGTFGYDPLPQMRDYTYWTTPLYPLAVGFWFKVFGSTIEGMRLISLAFGLALILSWGYIAWKLTQSSAVSALTISLTALNARIIWGATNGRPDMMAAGLASLGIAWYLRFRVSNMRMAMVGAAALTALGGLAHPLASVEGILLCVLVLVLDRNRLTLTNVALVVVTAAVIVAPWLVYMTTNSEVAKAQWSANSHGRFRGVLGTVLNVVNDIQGRYVHHHMTAGGIYDVQMLPIVACIACFFVALFQKHIRGRSGYLFSLALIAWLALAVLDGMKLIQYYVHVFPVYVAASAVVIRRLWQGPMVSRNAAAGLVAALVLPGLGYAYKVWQNPYEREYVPVVDLLRRVTRSGDAVITGSEFVFGLGFDNNFIDDQKMSIENVAVYVDNNIYITNFKGAWQRRLHSELATRYKRIYDTPRYRVYIRADIASERLSSSTP